MITFEPIVRRRREVIAAFVLVVAVAAPGLMRLEMDNAAEGFFVQDAAALQTFERMERDFGRDRGLRIVIETRDLWSPEGIRRLADLESTLSVSDQGIGGVYAAAGPWRHHSWHDADWSVDDATARAPEWLRSNLIDREAGWISADGTAVSVLVGLFRLSPDRRRLTLDAIEARLADLGIEAGLAGLPVVSRAIDDGQLRLLTQVFPWLIVVAVVLLALFFRSAAGVLLPLALVGVTEVVLFGLMGYAGQRIDFVTLLLLPLPFVIAMATAVHVVAYHRKVLTSGLDAPSAVVETYRVKAWPVLWTGVTTAVAFLSLSTSPVPPVQALGLWAAFGVGFATLSALSLLPALLPLAGTGAVTRPSALESWNDRTGRALGRLGVTHPGRVIVAFGVAALLALSGLPRLVVDTSLLSYFREDHAVRQTARDLDRLGLPQVSASLVLRAAETGEPFDSAVALSRLERLSATLRTEPLLTGVVSAGDLAADARQYLPADASGTETDIAARMRDVPDLRNLLAAALTDRADATRVVLFSGPHSYRELAPVYQRAETMAREAFPDADVAITGQHQLVLAAQRSVLRTMVVSLTATFAVVSLLFIGLLGSLPLAMRALAPNVWPVLVVVGSMGLAGVPIDSTTVMIAAIALGLAVDDTLHTLGHLRMRRPALLSERGRRTAIADSIHDVAGGHIVTSVVLCLGFLVPAASELLPVARFGVLSALAVVAALAADLLLTPALLTGVPARSLEKLTAPR